MSTAAAAATKPIRLTIPTRPDRSKWSPFHTRLVSTRVRARSPEVFGAPPAEDQLRPPYAVPTPRTPRTSPAPPAVEIRCSNETREREVL